MLILCIFLVIVIGGYTYLTDAERVRQMGEAYLSHLLGGRVEIGRATLSIFEGLRLDDVKVHVDPEAGKPDSLLFSAQAFVVNYDPRKLIAGQLEATEIIAQKPHVFLTLTQKPRRDEWNYHRLGRPHEPPAPVPRETGPHKLPLPTIMLRNAWVEISEVKAGQRCRVGSMAIDGQLTPVGDGEHFQFALQTRGGTTEDLGPYADGTVCVTTGQLDAHLHEVRFGEDTRAMFPADLRDWWERHDLSGRIKSVDVSYQPAHDGTPPQFRVETSLQGVTLAVHREEWSSHDEVIRWQRLQDAIALLRGPFRAAGFSVRNTLDKGPGMQAGAEPRSTVELMSAMVDTSPLLLRDVSGTFVFTQNGIDVKDLRVSVGAGDAAHPQASNTFRIGGQMGGYNPDAPLRLEVASVDRAGLYIPAHPKFVESLPSDVRQFFYDLQPQGHAHLRAEVNRSTAGSLPQVTGEMEVVDATFLFHQFPYPFRGAGGKIAFGRDPFSGKDYVSVINMRGYGMIRGPNEHSEVSVSGRVGPIGPAEPGFDLHATGRNICSEPALMAAMPPEVRKALRIFDAPGKGELPRFRGNFDCTILRNPGPRQRMTFRTDVELVDASASVVDFPYPWQHVRGRLRVHDDYVEVLDIGMQKGSAAAKVTGLVRWNDDTGRDQPLDLRLNVHVRGLAADKDLLSAIPAEQRQWLQRMGLNGKLDADGRIYTLVPADWREHTPPGHKAHDPPVEYDLDIGLKDGTLWPVDGMFSVSALAGKLHLTRQRLDILDLNGRRENADLTAHGWFTFSGARPQMSLQVFARNLSLDRPLYAMLPQEGRKAWDEVQPSGTVDAEVDYHGAIGEDPASPTLLADASPVPNVVPLTPPAGFHGVLHPRHLSVRVKTAPYPLTFNQGTVTIKPGSAILKGLVGAHGKGKLSVSGEGSLADVPVWKLSLDAQNLSLDGELRKAMPPMLVSIVDGLKLRGELGFHFSNLLYRGPASSQGDPDIDVAGGVFLSNGSMDVGMPLTKIHGGISPFAATIRQGKLDSLSGSLRFDSLSLSNRPMRELKLDLSRAPGSSELHVDNIQARAAGGELAGGVLLTFPDQGANRYSMNLVLRNADVRQLAGAGDRDILGQLTASLALEGAWGDPGQRRGRGDVVIAGKQLYQIPLMLGLLQVTNLSLPIGQPFTHGNARYTVDGTRVNFDQMDLRADGMMMTGTGYLDFGTRQVRMTLTTDNPNGFKIPFLHELWQGARQELLKINVRGTIQDPKVEPTSLGIFSTTVDEVFKGDNARK